MTNPNPTPVPDACPACGAAVNKNYSSITGYIPYECGAVYESKSQTWGGRCSDAFSHAITLRRELAQARAALETQHAATDALWNENSALRAQLARVETERDAPVPEGGVR